jgi:hypothetical protein
MFSAVRPVVLESLDPHASQGLAGGDLQLLQCGIRYTAGMHNLLINTGKMVEGGVERGEGGKKKKNIFSIFIFCQNFTLLFF